MRITFYIIAVPLVLLFMIAFANSLINREVKTRLCDFLFGVGLFCLFVMVLKIGGYSV